MKTNNLLAFLFVLSGGLSLRAGDLPTSSLFVQNKGQYGANIRYALKTSGLNLLFLDHSINYQFFHSVDSTRFHIDNVSLSFLQSNPKAGIDADEKTEGQINYLLGNDTTQWIRAVNCYKHLTYSNIYPDIDMAYHAYSNRAKYDFVVRPGGHPSDIVLHYTGLQDIQLDAHGNLKIITSMDTLLESIPEAYQWINGRKVMVHVEFMLDQERNVHFISDDFDSAQTLVIDPLMIYSTYLGGNANDYYNVGGMDRDSQGNVYTTFWTYSTNFPVTAGAYDITQNGQSDMGVVKINPAGNSLVFCTFIGGSDIDYAHGIQIDQTTHEVYVVGGSWSTNFPTTAGSYQPVHSTYSSGNADIVVVKLNSTGSTLLKSTFIGGTQDEQGEGITIDSHHRPWITGQATASLPTTAGTYQTTNHGDYDGYVAVLSSNFSTLVRSTFIGGANRDRMGSIKLDATQHVYVCGENVGGGFPTTATSYQPAFGGGTDDMVVFKMDSSLVTLSYSTYLGGNGNEFHRTAQMCLDNLGEVTTVGWGGNNYPTTAGAYDQTFNGGAHDAVVTELNAAGNGLIFSTYLGGSGDDCGNGIFFVNGHYLITGFCQAGFPTTANAIDATYNGGEDAFVVELSGNGSQLLYSTYVGGALNDEGAAIAGVCDTINVVGFTNSNDFVTTPGSIDQTFNGGTNDIMAFAINLDSITSLNIGHDTVICNGSPMTLHSGHAATHWSTGIVGPNITVSSPGTYTAFINTDCTVLRDTIHITSPTLHVSNDTTFCSGGAALITATSPGSTFLWSTGQSTASINVNATGSYSVIATNGTCAMHDTVQVNVLSAPSLIISSNVTLCQGDSTQLHSFTANTPVWSPATGLSCTNCYNPMAHPNSTTTYYCTVSASGCSRTDTVVITVHPLPSLSVSNDTFFCAGSSVPISATSPGNTLLWSSGQNTATIVVNSSGTYYVTATHNGCQRTDSVHVTSLPLPLVFIGNDTALCAGQILTLDATTAGATYHWNNGSTNATLSTGNTGLYWVAVTAGGCTARDSINVLFHPIPVVNLGPDTTVCTGQPVTFDAAASGATYHWSTGASTASITVSAPGTYSVVVTQNGCTDSDAVKLLNVDPVGNVLASDTTTCQGNLIPLHILAGTNPLWSTGAGTDTIIVLDAGVYYVTVQTFCGVVVDSETVTLNQCFCPFFMPNAFSPNGDGSNDRFRPIHECDEDNYDFTVFNRWGQNIFETHDINTGWDGTYKNTPQEVDVYVWVIQYNDHVSHNPILLKGNVTLLR